MTNNIKAAFGCIRAEDNLKAVTLSRLQSEIQKRGDTRRRTLRFAVALASVTILLLTGVFSYNLYLTPVTYLDMDVNPSIGLMLNSFDRVIDVCAYNEDGENILPGLSLRHKKYSDALIIILEAITQNGYILDDGLVSVTLQTNDLIKETELLANLQSGITGVLAEHNHRVQVDVLPISVDTRNHAHDQGISPAKYIAIQELIEVDPTATVDSCRNHSIGEIKQLTRSHIDDHHDGGNDTPYNSDDNLPDESERQSGNRDSGHHGDGHH